MTLPVDPCGMAMDDLRACYEEDMRFPGVGVRRVRWYFTDKDYLPIPHCYGAWRWFKEDESWYDWDDGGPGGILTRDWRFRNGQPPVPALGCTGPRGSPAAWVGEDTGERFVVGGYPLPVTDGWDFLTMGG